jgi:flagellar motor switch protein FliN/FliY
MSDETAAMQDAPAEDAALAPAVDAPPLQQDGGTLANPLFKQFTGSTQVAARNDIDMIMDIPVRLSVEIGRTRIAIKNLLQLAQGSVLELDSTAGEPLDVFVNGCLIAQGEAVIVNDKLGIRLTDIVTPSERLRKLNR